jgi:hypothetical protein
MEESTNERAGHLRASIGLIRNAAAETATVPAMMKQIQRTQTLHLVAHRYVASRIQYTHSARGRNHSSFQYHLDRSSAERSSQ